MAATEEAVGGTSRLAANAVVTLMASGACLARRGDHERKDLHHTELRILQDLAAGRLTDAAEEAAALGVDADQVQAFVDVLGARGLLRQGPAIGAAPTATPPASSGEGADPDVALLLSTPVSFRVTTRGFEHTGHEGDLLAVLDAAELDAASRFTRPCVPSAALADHQKALGQHALTPTAFNALLARLLAAGVASVHDETRPGHAVGQDRTTLILRAAIQQEMRVRNTTKEQLALHDQRAAEIDARVGHRRVPITPIHQNPMVPPLGLAMVMAYAKDIDGGRLEEHYDFRPEWLAHETPIEELTARPGIFLVSNYIWSHRDNLALAARIKAASPHSVMIHGGPDTPKYKGDVIDYFRINPHVDVAVHVEGEVTTAELLTALQGCVGDGPPDLSNLRDVAGLSFRDGDRVVQTGERGRLEDLDSIPSPYLTGLFDNYGNAPVTSITIETNRGCPYGCTFCDWGSATMSRIRKFDLDRVFAELEWAAQRGIQGFGFADANFGILERDVAIAEKVAALKEEYGFPLHCGTNYAKNTVKHLNKIVSLWVDAGIVTQGMLSLQTMDTETLTTIRRSNIKTEKYDALADEFRRAELPLFVDLMMGLPGQTVTSFRHDLQDTLEREVVAKIHPTTLLMNSPMNEPEYKKLHRIEVANSTNLGLGNRIDQTVVATSSFTREDYEEMRTIRRNFLLLENFGVLRHVARFVRHETGLLEEELYETVARLGRAQPERWPAIDFTVESGSNVMAPPVSWRQFVDEVHQLLVDELGVVDDDALATVLTVQHALLPAPDRSFPAKYHLAHDYAAWHQAMLDAKAQVGPEWTGMVPRLHTYGPAEFTVDDRHHVCTQGMGYEIEQGWLDTWDLESPVARPTLVREMAD
jgi:radical SAM superfamily enzyme YgiQ (UPF0313 family)